MQFKNATQRLGLSIFDWKLGLNNPAFLRVLYERSYELIIDGEQKQRSRFNCVDQMKLE